MVVAIFSMTLRRRLIKTAKHGGVMLVLIGLLSGCWDIVSPEHLTLPVLLAVDWSHHQYVVTLESAAPTLITTAVSGGAGGSGHTASPVWVSVGRAPTVGQALDKAGLNYPSPMALAHLQAIVVGRSVLQPQTLDEFLDAMMRSPFISHTSYFFASPNSAAPLAQVVNPTGLYPAQVLQRQVKRLASNGTMIPTRLDDWVSEKVDAPEDALIIPLVTPKPGPTPDNGAEFAFPGAWVLARNHIVGNLTTRQMQMLTLVAPDMRFPAPLHTLLRIHTDSHHSVVVAESSHRSQIQWKAGHIDIRLALQVNLVEDGQSPLESSITTSAMVTHALDQSLSHQILQLTEWSQRRQADIFQLGRKIAARHPRQFQAMAARWPEIYAHSTITVHVKSVLTNAGNLR